VRGRGEKKERKSLVPFCDHDNRKMKQKIAHGTQQVLISYFSSRREIGVRPTQHPGH